MTEFDQYITKNENYILPNFKKNWAVPTTAPPNKSALKIGWRTRLTILCRNKQIKFTVIEMAFLLIQK